MSEQTYAHHRHHSASQEPAEQATPAEAHAERARHRQTEKDLAELQDSVDSTLEEINDSLALNSLGAVALAAA